MRKHLAPLCSTMATIFPPFWVYLNSSRLKMPFATVSSSARQLQKGKSERNSIILRAFSERWLLSFRSKAHLERVLTFLWLIDLRIKWGASLQGFPFTSFYKFKMHFILMLKLYIYIPSLSSLLPSSCSVPILHLSPPPHHRTNPNSWWFEIPQNLRVGVKGAD